MIKGNLTWKYESYDNMNILISGKWEIRWNQNERVYLWYNDGVFGIFHNISSALKIAEHNNTKKLPK